MQLSLETLAPQAIAPRHREWRTHPSEQIDFVCRVIERHGLPQPILIDSQDRVVCGWMWVLGARRLRLNTIPVVRADHLSDEELRLYAVAASRLADRSGYDDGLLAAELQELQRLVDLPDFSHLGFEQAELDRLLGLTQLDLGVDIDAAPGPDDGPPISQAGDQWIIGEHRLLRADALDGGSHAALLAGKQVRFTLTDPPYNLRAKDISGRGRFKHQDFMQGAGEFSPGEFTRFLTTAMRHIHGHSLEGSLHAFFMGYQFLLELLRAGNIVFGRPKALCTWVKSNGGQGALFRARTEFIAYFKKGTAPHRNHIMLGTYGRNRTTAWEYDGMNTFSLERSELLEGAPTPKPVEMLRDAILDVTDQGDIVYDPFAGSGSVILAAHATQRRAFVMELDGRYADVALRRARKAIGIEPYRESDGALFSELEDSLQRAASQEQRR